MTTRALFVLAGVGLLLCGNVPASAVEADTLVFVQHGTLPILLTAPHGGVEVVPSVPERETGTRTRDGGTLELTRSISEGIERAIGGKPYVVAALFHRKFIDANRSEKEALEHPDAQTAYRAYHAQVRAFVSDLGRKYGGQVVLLDVHGQASAPDRLYRGTQNRKTVAHLLRRHGEAALTGRRSILGILEAKGYDVFPKSTAALSVREDPAYNGGFTVRTYGAMAAGGVDAIQLEFGTNLRKPGAKVAEDVAAAIAEFAKAYLPIQQPHRVTAQ